MLMRQWWAGVAFHVSIPEPAAIGCARLNWPDITSEPLYIDVIVGDWHEHPLIEDDPPALMTHLTSFNTRGKTCPWEGSHSGNRKNQAEAHPARPPGMVLKIVSSLTCDGDSFTRLAPDMATVMDSSRKPWGHGRRLPYVRLRGCQWNCFVKLHFTARPWSINLLEGRDGIFHDSQLRQMQRVHNSAVRWRASLTFVLQEPSRPSRIQTVLVYLCPPSPGYLFLWIQKVCSVRVGFQWHVVRAAGCVHGTVSPQLVASGRCPLQCMNLRCDISSSLSILDVKIIRSCMCESAVLLMGIHNDVSSARIYTRSCRSYVFPAVSERLMLMNTNTPELGWCASKQSRSTRSKRIISKIEIDIFSWTWSPIRWTLFWLWLRLGQVHSVGTEFGEHAIFWRAHQRNKLIIRPWYFFHTMRNVFMEQDNTIAWKISSPAAVDWFSSGLGNFSDAHLHLARTWSNYAFTISMLDPCDIAIWSPSHQPQSKVNTREQTMLDSTFATCACNSCWSQCCFTHAFRTRCSFAQMDEHWCCERYVSNMPYYWYWTYYGWIIPTLVMLLCHMTCWVRKEHTLNGFYVRCRRFSNSGRKTTRRVIIFTSSLEAFEPEWKCRYRCD